MGAKVIDIFAKEPHLNGEAVCLNCKHKWTAISPVGTYSLECPECKVHKGVYNGVCIPEETWECECGCLHFFISPEYARCAHCGIQQNFG